MHYLVIYMLVFYAIVFVHCIAFCPSATEALINNNNNNNNESVSKKVVEIKCGLHHTRYMRL